MPAIGVGMVPAGQPLAGAMLTVGIRRLTGAGRVGLAPVSWAFNSVAVSPQALSAARKVVSGSATKPAGVYQKTGRLAKKLTMNLIDAYRRLLLVPNGRCSDDTAQSRLKHQCAISQQSLAVSTARMALSASAPASGRHLHRDVWRTSVLVGSWSTSASNFARLRPAAFNTAWPFSAVAAAALPTAP